MVAFRVTIFPLLKCSEMHMQLRQPRSRLRRMTGVDGRSVAGARDSDVAARAKYWDSFPFDFAQGQNDRVRWLWVQNDEVWRLGL